jgi:hypothetical protein
MVAASRTGRFTPVKYPQTVALVGSRIGLDIVVKREIWAAVGSRIRVVQRAQKDKLGNELSPLNLKNATDC